MIYWDVNQLKYVIDNWDIQWGPPDHGGYKTIQHCKRRDIVIRYGGDEIYYVANGTKEIAEQLIKTWKVRLEE